MINITKQCATAERIVCAGLWSTAAMGEGTIDSLRRHAPANRGALDQCVAILRRGRRRAFGFSSGKPIRSVLTEYRQSADRGFASRATEIILECAAGKYANFAHASATDLAATPASADASARRGPRDLCALRTNTSPVLQDPWVFHLPSAKKLYPK